MVVVDGIEVYLKPAMDGGESLKFPELEVQPIDDLKGAYKCAFVPMSNDPFQVVIRFANDYEMFSASAIQIGVGTSRIQYRTAPRRANGNLELIRDGDSSERGPFIWSRSRGDIPENVARLRICQRSRLAGQQHTFNTDQSGVLRMKGIREDRFPMSQEFVDFWNLLRARPYRNVMNPGTITVFIQRGRIEWLDEPVPREEQSLWGKGDPTKLRPFKSGTFKHLRSKNGKKYRIEFRPRSNGRLLEIEDWIRKKRLEPPLGEEQKLDQTRYQMQEDHDFARAEEQTASIRESMSKEYEARMQREQQRKAKQAIRPKKKSRAPPICNCPPETHTTPTGKNAKALSKCKRGDQVSSRKAKQTASVKIGAEDELNGDHSSGVEPTSERQSEDVMSTDTQQTKEKTEDETVAKTCGKCKMYKKPPRGKKFAWRERKGKWMYVHQDAPEDPEPDADGDDEEVQSSVSPVQGSQPRQQGDDSDEELSDDESTLEDESAAIKELETAATSIDVNSGMAEQATGSTTETTEDTPIKPGTGEKSQGPSSPSGITPDDHGLLNLIPIVGNDETVQDPAEIDLTGNDDDEITVLRSVTIEPGNRKPKFQDDDDTEDLEYRLEKLQRQKRMLEIDEEQAEIKRKLARRAARNVKKADLKEEIKIED